jgi:putative flippase GtrA
MAILPHNRGAMELLRGGQTGEARLGAPAVLSEPVMNALPPSEGAGRRLLAAWRQRAFALKAMSFALVGLVNFAIDFGVFSLGYFYLGLPIIFANVVAWIIAVSNSYVMNSLTTFAAESGRQLRLRDYAAFAVSQIGGLVTNTATVFIASYVMPVLSAKLLAIGAGFLVNFTLSHFIVFRPRETRH